MSVQDHATQFDEMNEGAVKAVLIGIIPIFGTVITIGWGNIFAALPIFDGHLSIIAYCFGLFLAFIGIKLTKAIAVGADSILTTGGAAEKLDYLEVVHVLIRRPNSSS
jgi:hypothetical protein